jgi:hypothetical protein
MLLFMEMFMEIHQSPSVVPAPARPVYSPRDEDEEE